MNAPLPPGVPPPTRPPGSARRLLGIPLGLAIEAALCFVSAWVLNLAGTNDLWLFFGVAQVVPAIPVAILCWMKDLKATAITLAISSAFVLLLLGGAGVLFWATCAQGRGRI